MGVKKPKVVKTFIWLMRDKSFIPGWNEFKVRACVAGQSPGEYLMELVRSCLRGLPKLEFTPVRESELIEDLKRRGDDVSRVTLRKWKKTGVLADHEGPFWFTDGNVVIYNLEKMREVAERRRSLRES